MNIATAFAVLAGKCRASTEDSRSPMGGSTENEGSDAVASAYRTLNVESTDFVFLGSQEPIQLIPVDNNRRIQWLLPIERRTWGEQPGGTGKTRNAVNKPSSAPWNYWI